MTTAADLKALANAQNARWPQYAGHFENYVPVRIKRRIVTKMGLAFEKGELAIARPLPNADNDKTRTVYSTRNKIDTSIFAKDIEVLQ